MIQVNGQTNFINGLKAKNGALSSTWRGRGLAADHIRLIFICKWKWLAIAIFFHLLLDLLKAANEETERSQMTTFQVPSSHNSHLPDVACQGQTKTESEDEPRQQIHYKWRNSYRAINHPNNRRYEIMGALLCLFICLFARSFYFFFGTDVLIGAMHLWSVFRWHAFTTCFWCPSRCSYSGFCACWLPPAEALSIKMRHFLSAAPGSW